MTKNLYSTGKELLNKEAFSIPKSVSDLGKNISTTAKDVTNRGKDYFNSLRSTSKGKNRFFNKSPGSFYEDGAKKTINKRRAIVGGVGIAGVGAGTYALSKRNSNKEASYYVVGKKLLEKDAIAMPKSLSNLGQKLKDKANLFRKTEIGTPKPGKNRLYNNLSNKGNGMTAKDIQKKVNKERLKTGLGAAGIVGGTGALGVYLSKKKQKES